MLYQCNGVMYTFWLMDDVVMRFRRDWNGDHSLTHSLTPFLLIYSLNLD